MKMSVEERYKWERTSEYWPTAPRGNMIYTYCRCVFEGHKYSDQHQFLTMCVALGLTEEEVVAYRARQRLEVNR